jgi:hypothetical protein
MNHEDISNSIKRSFGNLIQFKPRGSGLEVITAFSTLNNKFVSVFIHQQDDTIVISDNGWVDQNYYDTPLNEDAENIIKRVLHSFSTSYDIKTTVDATGLTLYYKTCKTAEEIPTTVFDLANFITGVVNAYCVQYKDEKEERERESFRREVNDFLMASYQQEVKLRSSLDDYRNIKFNAIINRKSNLYLVTYITGSTAQYFENDARKSIVNFEIAAKSKYHRVIKEKVAIIDDRSEGFLSDKSSSILQVLAEKTTIAPVLWTEREKLLEIIEK